MKTVRAISLKPTISPPDMGSRTLIRCILAALTILGGQTASARGQTITGQVTDSLSGRPVGSGFVLLIDEQGQELVRVLTGTDGAFMLEAPSGSNRLVRLRSERIGYRPSATSPFTIPSTTLTPFVIRVMALPRELAQIDVRDHSECRVRASAAQQTAVVWEEARKALQAASWTASQQPYHVVSDISVRDLDGRGERVEEESHRPSIGLSTNPFVSRSPAELVQTGYVSADGDGFVYTSPDAHVLQSDGFVDTHCFRLVERDGSASLGLAFEPVPSRRLPDVSGVLWIDRGTWELRSLEYSYVNLPDNLEADDLAGGSIDFLPLPSGAWIVHRWTIRFPTGFREERVGEFDRRTRRRPEAVREVGGEVMTIHERTGALVYETDFAEIVGLVVDDSRGGVPASGTIVHVVGTWFRDTTDQEGRFHLRVPLAGTYGLAASNARIDSLVFGPEPESVRLQRGAFAEARIVIPPLADLFASVCPERPPGPGSATLVGTVIDSATGTPVVGAEVAAFWQHITPELNFFNRHTKSTTDAMGRFALCGIEVSRPALVYAVTGQGRSEVLRVGFEPGHVEIGPFGAEAGEVFPTLRPIVRRDLSVSPVEDATLLTGTVVDGSDGAALEGVDVQVVGKVQRVRTDSSGQFVVRGLEPGTQEIHLSKPGYAPRVGEAEVHDDQPTVIDGAELSLRPVAQLSGVVREHGTNRPLNLAWLTLVDADGDSLVRSRSDSLGRFVLTAPREGRYSAYVRRLGYVPTTLGPFDLRPGQAVETIASLQAGALALDPIEVVGEATVRHLESNGFYRRRQFGQGIFLDRNAIETRAAASTLGQLLSGKTGVRVDGDGKVRLRGGPTCQYVLPPAVWVDGVRLLTDPLFAYEDWHKLVPTVDMEAVEVFTRPSHVPAEYNTGGEAACGVILIWTRRGQGR